MAATPDQIRERFTAIGVDGEKAVKDGLRLLATLEGLGIEGLQALGALYACANCIASVEREDDPTFLERAKELAAILDAVDGAVTAEDGN